MSETAQGTVELPSEMKEIAELLYGRMLTAAALEEASRPENVGAEVMLLRTWLKDAMKDREDNHDLMLKLFQQIVRAVSVKYRLSAKRQDDFASALLAMVEQVNGQFFEDEV
jgi:hypothetical protein